MKNSRSVSNSTTNSVKNRPKSKGKNNRRRNRRGGTRRMPIAYVNNSASYYKTVASTNNSVRVRGFDLVSATVVSDDISASEFVFSCISSNPAYWTGTRVASIAAAYTQYRPMKFKVHYFPQVPTTSQGLITAGTIWDNETRSSAFQQTLATSNGGKIYPVYSKAIHNVSLKTALSKNMFDIAGFLNSDTNPFTFLATTYNYNGITPGYFMVEWDYLFKNPVGEGATYESMMLTRKLTVNDVYDNTTIVLAKAYSGYGPGTTISVRKQNNIIAYAINGKITIDNDPNTFDPDTFYLYRTAGANNAQELLLANLPRIDVVLFKYVDTNQTTVTFYYTRILDGRVSAPRFRRIDDNARSTPVTGWIFWSASRRELQWWPGVVIQYVDDKTPESITDYDVYVMIDAEENISAVPTTTVDRFSSRNLTMLSPDNRAYETQNFAGSIAIQ